MTALNKQALREAAEKATPGDWRRASTRFNGITATPFSLGGEEVMLAGTSEKRDAEFIAAANPATVLALLDENYRLTAERDALRENIGGDNTRNAADIYFQLVEECEIPPGGSLVGYIDDIKERLSNAENYSSELDNALCELLPGTQYMDPPDGGSVTPLEQVRRMVTDYRDRIAVLSASHSKLRDTMAAIHNTIRMDGGYTPLAAILNAAKRAHEESAIAAGIGVKGE